MSGMVTLDRSTAAWLGALDPSLSLLPDALPDPPAGWQLHDVRWIPDDGCRLSYRGLTAGTTTTFVAVDVTTERWSRRDYRDDERLPGLAAAADPAQVGPRLTTLLGEPPISCRVVPVRYRPGSRCVLRYEVTTRHGPVSLFAKVLRPDRFAATASLARQLSRSARDGALVPPVRAVWDDLCVLLSTGLGGRPVSEILADAAVPAGERTRVAQDLGRLLARFHAVDDVPAPAWTAGDQVDSVAAALEAVTWVDARLATRLRTALDVLAADPPPPAPHVLSHGSFRPGQAVRTAHGTLVVLDLDRVSHADPARDLGEALAHLTWQGVRHPLRQAFLRAGEHALLDGYQGTAGSVDADALRWWRAAALVQVAARRYRRLEVATWPAVCLLADAAEELLPPGRRPTDRAGSPDVLDCAQMTSAIRAAVAPAPDSPPVRVRSAQLLREAGGRRSVVRYTLDGLDPDAAVPVIGKVFAEPRRARLLHQHLRILSQGPFREGPLRVPAPVALLPAQRMVLYRSAEGVALDRVLDPQQAAVGVRDAARWLARLHTSAVSLPRHWCLEREVATTRQWASVIADELPVAAGAARALADRWAGAVRSGGPSAAVPIHKDFHAGHVLVGHSVCVLDLDEARLGDPSFDVAHFCTYLEAAGQHPPDGPVPLAFRDAYVAATGWQDRGTYAPFRAYSWLKVAKQLTLGSGPFPPAPAAARVRLVSAALERGLACLDP